jgi:glutaredoxin
MKTVTLYTKLGCHLCEVVEETIAQVGKARQFAMIRRDISEDAADYEKYKHDIPVVLVDGVEIARHRMSADQLMRAL